MLSVKIPLPEIVQEEENYMYFFARYNTKWSLLRGRNGPQNRCNNILHV